jgi:signal transduction histidine kinase
MLTREPSLTEQIKEQLKNFPDKEMMHRNLRLKRFNTGTKKASDIEKFIKKCRQNGFSPDLVIIDYFECLLPEKSGYTTDSEWSREAVTMRKLENMAKDLNIAIWIPTQGNKGSITSPDVVTMDQAGGSIRKVQICQVVISIARSLDDIDNQLFQVFLLVSSLMVLIIIFICISGAFFIRSIIIPVREINETAAKIAKGDFTVSIDKHKHNDEIGQLCETINNMAYEIGEADRVKSEFISTVSHELRTPLTAIKGWGETIRLSKDDDYIINKGLDVIVSESDRLSDLVEDLLDFSRMENGKLSLKVSEFDIVSVLNKVIESFETRSVRDNIKIIKDISVESLIINGDKNRIKQALINIIDNGFKYNKEDGHIKISLEATADKVVILISDNGCGISRYDLPRITEKFYKANNSVRGSGIGLAVTDEIIKIHNGEMNIESTIGEGTSVSIILPIISKENIN